MTEEIFRHDSYCRECEATVVSSGPDGIVLDRTVFYPNGGGQPGDQGVLRTTAGDVTIVDTLKGANGIRHVPVEGADLPAAGSQVTCAIDWARRYRHMRMHSCMHVLCSLVEGGGNRWPGWGRKKPAGLRHSGRTPR